MASRIDSARNTLLVACQVLVAACNTDEQGSSGSNIQSGTPRDAEDADARFELILGENPSESVLADVETLMAAWAVPDGIEDEDGERIVIEYLGLGTLGPMPEQDEQRVQDEDFVAPEDDPSRTSFVGINPATRNQFRVTMPRDVVEGLEPELESFDPAFDGGPGHGLDIQEAQRGAQFAESPPGQASDGVFDLVAEADPQYGWAGNLDNRERVYGLNAPVAGVQRWQIEFGSCSGSLVGPRHVLTAGHCLFNFTTSVWSDDFWITAGRNGTSSLASVFADGNNIPPGQNLWYWVHSDYLATGARENDIGLIVTPAVLAGSAPGQTGCFDGQCWFGYAGYAESDYSLHSYWRMGYPLCDPAFNGTTARIDEPCQTGTWDPNQTCLNKPCNSNHLYGVTSSCAMGEFASPDSWGQKRIVHHGCSASAADSGSPLYHKHPVHNWVVLSVQTSQECGATALCPAAPASQLARPMIDTRLTGEYRGWITNFRTIYP